MRYKYCRTLRRRWRIRVNIRLQLLSFLFAVKCADIARIRTDNTAACTSGEPVSSTKRRCLCSAHCFCALVRSRRRPFRSMKTRRTISGWLSRSSPLIPMIYVFSNVASAACLAASFASVVATSDSARNLQATSPARPRLRAKPLRARRGHKHVGLRPASSTTCHREWKGWPTQRRVQAPTCESSIAGVRWVCRRSK